MRAARCELPRDLLDGGWLSDVEPGPFRFLCDAGRARALAWQVRQAVWRQRLWAEPDMRIVSAGIPDYLTAVPQASKPPPFAAPHQVG